MYKLIALCAVALAAAAAKKEPAPLKGIRTPGVQIPFASLKPETELPAPAKPAWLFFDTSVYFPNSAGGLEKVDPRTAKPATPVPAIPKPCAGMASGFGSLWIPSCADGSLTRLDSKTLKQTAKFTVGTGDAPHAIAASPDSIWVLSDNKTTLSRIDPDQNMVVGELRIPAGCRSLIFGETALWLACPSQNQVYRINPATNLVVNRIDVAAQPESLAVGEGSIWAFCRKEGKVDRIDPKTNKITKSIDLAVPGAEGEILFAEGSVWVTMSGFPLTRIAPTAEKETVAQQFTGSGGGALAASPGFLWLSNLTAGTVWKVDPKRVLATLAE